MRKITIAGVEFETEMRNVYVRYGVEDAPSVMVSRYGEKDWEISIHDAATSEVIEEHSHQPNKDICVRWAIAKGYLPNPKQP